MDEQLRRQCGRKHPIGTAIKKMFKVLWDIRHTNICIIRVPEEERERD